VIPRLFFLTPLLLLCGCTDPYRVPEQEKAKTTLRWAIENPARRPVELWLHQGHTLVESAPAGSNLVDVIVDVTIHAKERKEAQRLLDDLDQSRPRSTDQTIKLQLTLPLGAALESVEMNYRVLVPADCELRIFTKSGRVALRSFAGKARVESESGDISARLDGGDVTLYSGTGTVRVEGAFHRANLKSRSGALELVVPEMADGTLAALESETGSVGLEMSATASVTLDYRSQSGKIDSELPLLVSDSESRPSTRERAFVGKLGEKLRDTLARITVRTDQGTFSVRKLPDGTR